MKLQKQGKVYTAEEQIGCDMEKLIERFSGNELFTNMTSYKDLVRVFSEQFMDNDGKAELNKHPGGKILLNQAGVNSPLLAAIPRLQFLRQASKRALQGRA